MPLGLAEIEVQLPRKSGWIGTMTAISFKRHRFPPDVIRYTVWLYYKFTLNVRDVEELLSQRGIEAMPRGSALLGQ